MDPTRRSYRAVSGRGVPCTGVLPGVIFAVDAYLALVRDSPLLIAVASSLTELFSRDLISLRMDQMRVHYPYLIPGLAYFEGRLTQAPEDAAFALDYVSTHAKTRAEQEQVIRALERKCEILWAQLDAIDYAYVSRATSRPAASFPGPSHSDGPELHTKTRAGMPAASLGTRPARPRRHPQSCRPCARYSCAAGRQAKRRDDHR